MTRSTQGHLSEGVVGVSRSVGHACHVCVLRVSHWLPENRGIVIGCGNFLLTRKEKQ